MTTNLLFALGTLATWLGIASGIRALIALAQLAFNRNHLERTAARRRLMISAGLGAAFLFLASILPMTIEGRPAEGWRFPLVWFAMPFPAWLGVVALVMIALRVFQAMQAIDPVVQKARLLAIGGWAVTLAVAIYLFQRDPAHKIDILRGGINLSGQAIGAILLFAVLATGAMVAAAQQTASRGVSKAIVTQIALLAGSFVFGLPFAFLVVTSFKEDRDMSSPNGIVWIPKVQETVPYLDPKVPLYAGTFDGQPVEGSIVEKLPDGTVRIDIIKPFAIRGTTFVAKPTELKQIPRLAPMVTAKVDGQTVTGLVVEDLDDGRKRLQVTEPTSMKGQEPIVLPTETEPVRNVGLRTQNYPEALSFLPPETNNGLVYLKNTLILVLLSVIGTIASSSIVAYAFSRMQFPGRNFLFTVLLATMMLPGAVTLLPQFLIFRTLGWIDTLYPLWVPAFFASAFNVFLLRQFFMGIPMELEDAAKIDGCSYLKTFGSVMLPQIKPALVTIAIWTFMGAWNNFMGPLIYINSPENMPLAYALQLFQGERSGEPGLMMAFATLTILPVLALFFFAQRYFIDGVTLSGLGGR